MLNEELLALYKKKEQLENDDSIDDDEYYSMIEFIDNKIVNDYTLEEIEEVEKFLYNENK